MNGGLTTLSFTNLHAHATSPVKSISSQNVRPMFVNRAISLCGEPSTDEKTAKLWAQDDTGALALNATAEFV